MRIINLKQEEYFIDQYIDLRNQYCDLLLTLPVNVCDTIKWLKGNDVEVIALAQDRLLLGVTILYLNKCCEISFFTKEKNNKIGSRLLEIIDQIAIDKKLNSIWAWVLSDNFIAQRVFEKSGFEKRNITLKEYKGSLKKGFEYIKYYTNEKKNE